MAAFELEKLAVTLSKLPGPTHQLVLGMHIYTLTVHTRLAFCSFSALWRLQAADQPKHSYICSIAARTYYGVYTATPRGVANIHTRIIGIILYSPRVLHLGAFHL